MEDVTAGDALGFVESVANFPDALASLAARKPVGGIFLGMEAVWEDMDRAASRRDQEFKGPVSGWAKIWLERHGYHLCCERLLAPRSEYCFALENTIGSNSFQAISAT